MPLGEARRLNCEVGGTILDQHTDRCIEGGGRVGCALVGALHLMATTQFGIDAHAMGSSNRRTGTLLPRPRLWGVAKRVKCRRNLTDQFNRRCDGGCG